MTWDPPTVPQVEPPRSRSGAVVWLVGGAVLFVALSTLGALAGSDEPSGDRAHWAHAACQSAMSDGLRSPNSAEFPADDASGVSIRRQSDGEWLVYSYVDAENAFGTMIRTDYTCRTVRVGDEGWRVLNLDVAP